MFVGLCFSQVIVITRHGARTPYSSAANDVEYNCSTLNYNFRMNNEKEAPENRLQVRYDIHNELKGNCVAWQLLNEGYKQHERLGKLLSRLYPGLYKGKLRSTDFTRVIMSLAGQLTEPGVVHIAPWEMDSFGDSQECPSVR